MYQEQFMRVQKREGRIDLQEHLDFLQVRVYSKIMRQKSRALRIQLIVLRMSILLDVHTLLINGSTQETFLHA